MSRKNTCLLEFTNRFFKMNPLKALVFYETGSVFLVAIASKQLYN